MSLLTKIFGGRIKNDVENKQRNKRYPLSELEKYVGNIIEVHRINQDIPKIERGILKFPPNEDSFYIGEGVGYHIVCWDQTNMYGKRDAVKLIKDKHGKEIYKNDEILFDYKIIDGLKQSVKSNIIKKEVAL